MEQSVCRDRNRLGMAPRSSASGRPDDQRWEARAECWRDAASHYPPAPLTPCSDQALGCRNCGYMVAEEGSVVMALAPEPAPPNQRELF